MRKQHLDLLGQSLIPSTIDIMNRAAYDASEAGLTEEVPCGILSILNIVVIRSRCFHAKAAQDQGTLGLGLG